MDTTPIRESPGFRALFFSRTATVFGSQVSEVALLVQVKQVTGSALAVGLLGAAELVPLIGFGLYGGTLADRLDRRRVALATEAALGAVALALVVNALLPRPALAPLYVAAAAIMALMALQRPSLDAALPRVVPRDRLPAAAALFALSYNASAIAGPALGGFLAAGPGPVSAYALDAATFAASIVLLRRMPPLPATGARTAEGERAGGGGRPMGRGRDSEGGRPAGGGRDAVRLWRGTGDAVRYALGRQELLGSYLVDLAAMILAFPAALFPFVADEMGAPWALGPMYAAAAVGAVLASAASGWTGRVRRHGRAIALAAAVWGGAIIGFGLTGDPVVALACLVVAGGADMVSGVFRQTLWNQTIPDGLRGRLAGLELISYGAGEPLGRVRSGAVAGVAGPAAALWTGGAACVVAVTACCLALPRFWAYRAVVSSTTRRTGA